MKIHVDIFITLVQGMVPHIWHQNQNNKSLLEQKFMKVKSFCLLKYVIKKEDWSIA